MHQLCVVRRSKECQGASQRDITFKLSRPPHEIRYQRHIYEELFTANEMKVTMLTKRTWFVIRCIKKQKLHWPIWSFCNTSEMVHLEILYDRHGKYKRKISGIQINIDSLKIQKSNFLGI